MDMVNICARCGGPGANAYNSLTGASGEWTHHSMGNCIEHLRGRAVAAEAKIAQLEAQIARQTFVTDRKPLLGERVEMLVSGVWEWELHSPWSGRWCDETYQTITGVRGWRPMVEEQGGA